MLEKYFSKAPYPVIVTFTKICGFAFFTISTKNGRFEPYQSRVDYFAMVVSFSFSLIVLSTIFYNDEPARLVKSVILGLGTTFMWNLTLVSAFVMKLCNVVGLRIFFSGIKNIIRIDNQVRWLMKLCFGIYLIIFFSTVETTQRGRQLFQNQQSCFSAFRLHYSFILS